MAYYKILNLTRNATNLEIENAYYKMARKYHPDKKSKWTRKIYIDSTGLFWRGEGGDTFKLEINLGL